MSLPGNFHNLRGNGGHSDIIGPEKNNVRSLVTFDRCQGRNSRAVTFIGNTIPVRLNAPLGEGAVIYTRLIGRPKPLSLESIARGWTGPLGPWSRPPGIRSSRRFDRIPGNNSVRRNFLADKFDVRKSLRKNDLGSGIPNIGTAKCIKITHVAYFLSQ